MSTCSLDFVDSISATPTVRLNLSDGEKWILGRNETDFSPPPLKRAIASTLLTDGGVIPSSAYDLRRITLELSLGTGAADDTAFALQALHRQLDRPSGNILRWWDHTTHPVFFRTFRASASSVRRIGFADGRRKRILVDLLAEPFAYGLLETPVLAQVLDTDPANSNGNFLDASSIKGDVETPSMIRWPASAVVANRETLFANRRRNTPSAAPFGPFQAENQTNGTDTTDQANASFSGGSGTRTTFATATMVTRSTISDLGTASVDLRGQYRVFARYAKTVSGDTINMRIQWGTSGGTVTTNDSYAAPSGTTIQMADLGLIQVPRGWDPTTNLLDGVEVAVSDTFHIAFQASRTGSGNLDVDYFILVPADDRLAIVKWVEAGPDRWWLSAHDNSAHARNSSDQIASGASPGLTGGLPMLAPNQTNRLYMVYEVGSGLTTTLTTITVTVSYYPRYLSVRPAST